MSKVLFFTFLNLVCYSTYSQGVLDGFIDAPKSKNLALSISLEKATVYFLADRELELPITSNSFSIFYKHQFNKWLGAAINLPLVNLTPQDGNIYLKTGGTLKINEIISVNGVLGVGISHPLTDYNTESQFSVGQQTKAINLRAISQITFKNSTFINGRIGYNSVQSPTPNSTVYSLKLGYYQGKWYADVWYENIMADGGKDYRGTGDLAPNSFTELGVSNSKIGGVVYHQTKDKLGLFISGATSLDGRNSFKTTRISTGVVLKL